MSKKYNYRKWSVAEKMEIVKARENGLTMEDVHALYGVSRTAMTRWSRAWKIGGLAALEATGTRKPRPSQWSAKTQAAGEILDEIIEDQSPRAGVGQIQGALYRRGFLDLAKDTVRRLLERKGYPLNAGPKPKTRKPYTPKSFERAKPNDLWQTDIMSFMLKGQYRVYLIGFMDDNSRFIVGWGLFRLQTAANVIEVFKAAIEKHNLPKEVLSDNGRQYYTWRGKSAFTVMLTKLGIRHIRSRPYHPQTLGKIESFWRNLYQECLAHTPLSSFEEAKEKIGRYIEHYNFKRPHQGIANLTPSDRFYGVGEQVKELIDENTAKLEQAAGVPGDYRPPAYIVGNLGGRELRVVAKEAQVTLSQNLSPELIKSDSDTTQNDGNHNVQKQGEPGHEGTEPNGETSQSDAEDGAHPLGDRPAPVGQDPVPASRSFQGDILPVDETGQRSGAAVPGSESPGSQAEPENQKSPARDRQTPDGQQTAPGPNDRSAQGARPPEADGGISQENHPQERLGANPQSGD